MSEVGEFSCGQPTCPQLHPQLSICWPLILSHTVIKIKMQPNELYLEAGLSCVHPPWKAFSSRDCLLWFLLSLRYGLNLPCLQVYVSEGQSQRGELEECRPEVGWGGAIMGPQSFSSLEKGFLTLYHGGAMPWNLQNADLHKHFLHKVSQPQAFHYGYRKFILLLQFLCRVLACLLWLQEGHGFPVFELCWSHLADLLWGQAQGILCANLNSFPLSSGRNQWMSQHLQRGRKDCDLGLLVVKNKGILVVKPVQRQGNSLTQVSRSLASFPWTSSGSNPPSFSLLLKLGLC